MDHKPVDAVVVGAGVFGASVTLELVGRGLSVALLDPGPLPHPEASSTDISKVVRMDYGRDAFYARLAEAAMARWRTWRDDDGLAFFREVGFLLLAAEEMAPGGFEYESRAVLAEMGYAVETLRKPAIGERFPAWAEAGHQEAYFNPNGGWAPSGAVVSWLIARACSAGAELREGVRAARLALDGSRVVGVTDDGGGSHPAPTVVVAAGAWTPMLVPWLGERVRIVGQPVYHLAPESPERFDGDLFPTWSADLSTTGWYGFPVQSNGIVKVANHGAGIPVDPRGPKQVPDRMDRVLRAFLEANLPWLADAPIAARRLCMYCDTFDGDFWIDRDPDHPGLIVAAGGSGHGFKFAPLLGEIVADVLQDRENPWQHRFRWRSPDRRRTEHARFAGDAWS